MAVVMMTALTVACGKQSSSNGEAEQRDTIPAPVPVEQQYLPDTAYASVSALQFQVEKNDSSDAMLRGTELYTDSSRVLTFRKNQWRNADFAGRVTGTPSKIEVAWQFDTYMDNREFYLKMLAKLPESPLLDQMRDALGRGDASALFSASHALKGLYASLALTPLHAICSEIVEIARAGSTEGVAERLERLDKMHREVLEMTKRQETDQ